jgi:hypothetical protein
MPSVEFGTLEAANQFRDAAGEFLAPVDDRRVLTVKFTDETPESIMQRAETQGYASVRAASEGAGMEQLTAHFGGL